MSSNPQKYVPTITDAMVTAAARKLSDIQAEECGVDKDNNWMIFGEAIKDDAKAMLEAAFAEA